MARFGRPSLRSGLGLGWDIGYPRVALRPDVRLRRHRGSVPPGAFVGRPSDFIWRNVGCFLGKSDKYFETCQIVQVSGLVFMVAFFR